VSAVGVVTLVDMNAIRSRRRETALGALVPLLVGGFRAAAQAHPVEGSGAPRLLRAVFPPFEVFGHSLQSSSLTLDVYSSGSTSKLLSLKTADSGGAYLNGTVSVIGWSRGDWEVDLANAIVSSGALSFTQIAVSSQRH
jgi:hypothetical protein